MTGAVRQEFPTAFLASQSYILPYDFDHDGRYELLMIRNGFSVSPLTTCYRWNGSSFATMFSHQNEYNGIQVGPFRSLGYDDLLELGTVNGVNHDIRVRAFDGSVVFSTSTDIRTLSCTTRSSPPASATWYRSHTPVNLFTVRESCILNP